MKVESALGFVPKIEKKPGSSLQKARLDAQLLARALSHWRSLAAEARPALRSLAHSSTEGRDPVLNVVLDLGDQDCWLCLELPVAEAAFPDFSAIWPYCRWWQEELINFSGLRFESERKTAGVTWRLA